MVVKVQPRNSKPEWSPLQRQSSPSSTASPVTHHRWTWGHVRVSVMLHVLSAHAREVPWRFVVPLTRPRNMQRVRRVAAGWVAGLATGGCLWAAVVHHRRSARQDSMPALGSARRCALNLPPSPNELRPRVASCGSVVSATRTTEGPVTGSEGGSFFGALRLGPQARTLGVCWCRASGRVAVGYLGRARAGAEPLSEVLVDESLSTGNVKS